MGELKEVEMKRRLKEESDSNLLSSYCQLQGSERTNIDTDMDTLAEDVALASIGHPDYDLCSPVNADPLIEVQSIMIYPYDDNVSYNIWGRIYVLDFDKKGSRTQHQLYHRSFKNGDTLFRHKGYASKGYSLPLTGPTKGPISMVGSPTIAIKLESVCFPFCPKKSVWFVNARAKLDTSTTHPCYEQPKSLTLDATLGVVRVNYIVLPCACIAYVQLTLTNHQREEEEEEGLDIGSSPDVHVFGSVMAKARYGKTSANFILHNKSKDEVDIDKVAYEVPMKLGSRSFVCIPAYSSLLLTLNLTFTFKAVRRGGKDKLFSVNEESIEFRTFDGSRFFRVGKSSLEVEVDCYTSDHPCFLENINIVRPLSPPSSFKGAPPELMSWGRDRIEVFSVFVGHYDGMDDVDVYGVIGLKVSGGRCSCIFKRDENHPDKLSDTFGKALSLEGVTTGWSDWFLLTLRLKDKSGRLVDIRNDLHIYWYHYDIARDWFNRPLCSVVHGKHGFAIVHYIIFENAVKATLKVSVVAKKKVSDSSDSDCDSDSDSDCLPVVYGALAAQYSNYEYATTFQKNYWRSVLFDEAEKDACHLSEDGEIPLSKNVVSVPMGSSLIVDVDLHLHATRPSISNDDPSISNDDHSDHFKCFVEIEICDFECKKLTGEYYDVLFSIEWTEGM